jgi:hypothetical protein
LVLLWILLFISRISETKPNGQQFRFEWDKKKNAWIHTHNPHHQKVWDNSLHVFVEINDANADQAPADGNNHPTNGGGGHGGGHGGGKTAQILFLIFLFLFELFQKI